MQRRAVDGEKTDEELKNVEKILRKKRKCKKKMMKEEKLIKNLPKNQKCSKK